MPRALGRVGRYIRPCWRSSLVRASSNVTTAPSGSTTSGSLVGRGLGDRAASAVAIDTPGPSATDVSVSVSGQTRAVDALNRRAGRGELVLYTDHLGVRTPADGGFVLDFLLALVDALLERGDAFADLTHERRDLAAPEEDKDDDGVPDSGVQTITYADGTRYQASEGFSTSKQGDGGWHYEMEVAPRDEPGPPHV